MLRLLTLSLALQVALAADKIYTGFNYGAFWGKPDNAKKEADFLDGFNLAKNLSTDVSFNSARLFSCIEANTVDDYTGAFDAAVKSKTNLFLGFWITPAKNGDSNADLVKNELSALEKGFQKYGQALADLVIGLSVGNEDCYRFSDPKQVGLSNVSVASTIASVKQSIASSSFAKYMKDKPIGHVDTAQFVIVDNVDFVGMTAYPYWNQQDIAGANASFHGSLEAVTARAKDKSVWIAEIGWPFKGPQLGAAQASADNMQTFWSDVGCSLMGKFTTFWFELMTDSTADQPDWGLMDIPSKQPRIKNLNCGLNAGPSSSPAAPSTVPQTTVSSAAPNQSISSAAQSSPANPVSTPCSTAHQTKTVHTSTIVYVTVQPSPSVSSPNTTVVTLHVTSTVYNPAPPPSTAQQQTTLQKAVSATSSAVTPYNPKPPASASAPSPPAAKSSGVMLSGFQWPSAAASGRVGRMGRRG